MYVKINLLPKSYYETKAAIKLIVVFAVVLLIMLVVGIFWNVRINKQTAEVQEKIDIANQYKKQIDDINLEITNRQNEVSYYQVRVDAIQKVLDFNKTIPEPFNEVAKWTYEKVQYTSLSINGTSVSINGRARSINDIARYILNLYQASDTFNSGSISLTIEGMGSGASSQSRSGVPGMPSSNSPGMPGVAPGGATSGIPGSAAPTGIPGRAVASLGNASSGAWVNFTVSATLKKALSSPGFNIDAPAASANSFQGAVQGGVPGAMPPGVGTGASPIPGASATPGAMPPGAGTGASPIPGASATPGAMPPGVGSGASPIPGAR